MQEVLERAVRNPAEVAAALPATRAEIVPLHVQDDLTVLNVVWAPGMRIWPHNHLMWADIALYGGQEDNTFFRRTGGRVEAAGSRQLRTGDVAALGHETIHSVANPCRAFTGAIHVYGGDITSRMTAASGTRTPGSRCPTTSPGRSSTSSLPTSSPAST